MDFCSDHISLVKDTAIMKEDIKYIKDKLCTHVIEGEREGGFRDRLLIMERDLSELKKRFWFSAIIGGIIGALIGSGSNDVLVMFIKWVIGK